MKFYIQFEFELLPVFLLIQILMPVPICNGYSFTREKKDDCLELICGTDFEPICGSDGQTYPNSCNYNNAKCQEPHLTILQPGVCEAVASDSSDSPSLPATGNPPTTDVCGVIEECNKELYDPICGSNGVQYPNDCFFTVAYCQNTSLSVANKGDCSKPTEEDKCVDKICPFEEQVLCASNLKTYRNECEFNLAKCYIKDLTIQHSGKCDSNSEVMEGTHTKCAWNCETTYRPVCGTDNNTYKNMCHFEKAQCDNKALKIYRFAPC